MSRIDTSQTNNISNFKPDSTEKTQRLYATHRLYGKLVSLCKKVAKKIPPANSPLNKQTRDLAERNIKIATPDVMMVKKTAQRQLHNANTQKIRKPEAVKESATNKSAEFATWQTRLCAIYDEMDAREPGWSDDKRRLTVVSTLGSHDSGSYTTQSSKLAPVSVTQVDNLQKQLEGGVRFLDMRIRPSGKQFIINHGVVNGTDCKPELDQLFRFARKNPEEIITLKVKLGKDKANTKPDTAKLNQFYKTVIKPHEALFIKRDEATQNVSDIKLGDAGRRGNILLLIEHRGEGANPYLVNKFPTCWSYKKETSSAWVNTARDEKLLDKNEQHLRSDSETSDRKTLFISQYQKTSMTSLHPRSLKSLKHQAKSNVKVADSVLSAVRETPLTKPNIPNTDFVNEYGGERNKYQLI